MSVTYGFYNSLNGDRKYDAIQMSKLFDGIIKDGIFSSIGTCFIVNADTGLNNIVNVGVGRAWFQHTWTLNDSILSLEAPVSEVLLDRIDAVIIEVNTSEAVRANSIKIIQGTPSSSPVNPILASEQNLHQYALCYIYRAANSVVITQTNITNTVGSEATPFITGILQSISTDELVAQWETRFEELIVDNQLDFTTWFDHIKDQLSEDAAGNLQLEIDQITNTAMLKAIYEGSAAGVVKAADKLAVSRKIGNANFDGSGDVSLAQVGAEPAFSKNTAFNKNFGSAAGTVCQGNDGRLSDARRASNISMSYNGNLWISYS